MRRSGSSILFAVLIALAAAYVGHSSQGLPTMVASHFDAQGIADGFIQRRNYVLAALCAVVLPPVAAVLPISLAMLHPHALVNVPNRDYWLQPGRRLQTTRFVRRHLMLFGVALLGFTCYVHGLVVRANQSVIPVFPASCLVAGLTAFALFLVLWITLYLKRFRTLR